MLVSTHAERGAVFGVNIIECGILLSVCTSVHVLSVVHTTYALSCMISKARVRYNLHVDQVGTDCSRVLETRNMRLRNVLEYMMNIYDHARFCMAGQKHATQPDVHRKLVLSSVRTWYHCMCCTYWLSVKILWLGCHLL